MVYKAYRSYWLAETRGSRQKPLPSRLPSPLSCSCTLRPPVRAAACTRCPPWLR